MSLTIGKLVIAKGEKIILFVSQVNQFTGNRATIFYPSLSLNNLT